MRTSFLSRIAAPLAGLCLALSGCRAEKASAPVASPPSTDSGGTTAIAAVEHPEELLPASTVVAFIGKSPRRAAEVFGRDRIAEQFPDLYRSAAALSSSLVGRDMLDPASYSAVGIDPDGRTGVAIVSPDPEVFALFFTLSDPPRFRETVIEVASRAGTQVVSTSLGGAEILNEGSDNFAVVIRGDFGVIVAGRSGEHVGQAAQAIATVDPSRALAGSRTYRRTLGATAPGDLVGYADVAEILARSSARRADAPTMSNWAQEQLDEARARGHTPERIAEFEAIAKEETERQTRWRKRDEAQAALARQLFSSVEGVALRIDAKPSGAVFELRMPMGEDAFLRRLLREGKGAPPLSWALDGAPLLLLSGSLDTDAYAELVDLVARSAGGSYDGLAAYIKDQASLDLSSLRPLLTGAVGGALTLDGAPDFASIDVGPPSWLGFTVHAEVSDPAAMEALLAQIAKTAKPFGKAVRREAGRAEVSFDVPDWRRVYVSVAGRHLVVTTDRLLPERLAKGQAGNVEKKTKPSAAYGAMSLPDASVTYASEMSLLGWSVFMRSSMSHSMHALVESPDTEAIPKSRTWQKKKKELDAAQVRASKAQDALEGTRATAALEAIRPIGMTVVVAKLEDQGLWATGGQFVRAEGIAGAIVDVIAATQKMRTMEDTPEQQELNRLFEETSRLSQELHEIRQADIERVRSRKKR
jgi:hypothetical protein